MPRDRVPTRRSPHGLLFVAAAVVFATSCLAAVSPPSAVAARATSQGPAAKGAATPKAVIAAGDEMLTGTGDADGYHLYAAAAGDAYTWRPLATLQPGGYGEQKWIGRQCLTGDGHTVVAVVAPWTAANTEQGMDRGGIAYAIDAHTGVTRPLASGLSLAYFNPGCGADGTVALTGYLGAAQRPSRVTVIDTGDGDRIVRTVTVPDEVTSAVAAGGRVLAARGHDLVDLTSGGVSTAAVFTGQVTDVRAAHDGGVDLVAQGAATSEVWHVVGGAARKVGDGPAATTEVFNGRAGVNPVLYGAPVAGDVESLSADGSHVVVAPASGPAGATGPGGSAGSAAPASVATARRVGEIVSSLTTTALPAVAATAEQRLPADFAGETAASAATIGVPNTTMPQCAVPRNDIFKQVWQPTSEQVRWAVYQGVQGYLTDPRPTNPANYTTVDNPLTQLQTAAPDTDYPVLTNAPRVPMQVLYAILAQESNFSQASWHAVPGRSGNPLVADFYGINNPKNPNPGQLDYNYSDCGYGIAQITTGMSFLNGATTPSDLQVRTAVDYADNIAAAAQILQQKWQQLVGLGIISASADGTKLENWYEAIWGYNTGVYTDPASNRGLGWLNNPANPIYKGNRHPFLYYIDPTNKLPIQEYDDAKTPANWPYQERVFGWMQVPQVDANGNLEYRGTYNWSTSSGVFLQQPAANAFCDQQNNCTPAYVGSQTDPCPAENDACWWDQPVAPCSGSCVTDTPSNPANGRQYFLNKSPEPAATPGSATCALGANTPVTDGGGNLLAGTVLIDSEALPDQNPGEKQPNLMNCAADSSLTPPASAAASFTLLAADGNPIDGTATPSESAAYDLHQIGGGVGGHLFFTHTRPQSDAADEVTGIWKATLPSGRAYQIQAYVPDIAAASGHATYQIDTGGSTGTPTTFGSAGSRHAALSRTINQASHTNQWVSLGYYLTQGSDATATVKVALRTVTGSDDSTQGADIAFDALAFVPVPTGQYVAIGDSYSAGEGVLSGFDDGTDTTSNLPGDHGNLCHRSALSYPRLYASAKNLPIVQLTCSGSNSSDVAGVVFWYKNAPYDRGVLGTYYLPAPNSDGSVYYQPQSGSTVSDPGSDGGWSPSGHTSYPLSADTWNIDAAGSDYFYEPSYQTDLLAALKPRLVTVSVGGNDMGFADIVSWCVANDLAYGSPQSEPCDSVFANSSGPDKLTTRISSLLRPETDALTQIARAAGGPDKVVLITYPDIFQGTANGMGPYGSDCTAIMGLDQDYLKTKVPALDDMLVSAAAAASKAVDPTGAKKIRVVDERDAFAGHEACTASPYVTPPTIPPPSTSQEDNFFHPNAAGYAKLEADLAAKVPNP